MISNGFKIKYKAKDVDGSQLFKEKDNSGSWIIIPLDFNGYIKNNKLRKTTE